MNQPTRASRSRRVDSTSCGTLALSKRTSVPARGSIDVERIGVRADAYPRGRAVRDAVALAVHAERAAILRAPVARRQVEEQGDRPAQVARAVLADVDVLPVAAADWVREDLQLGRIHERAAGRRRQLDPETIDPLRQVEKRGRKEQ